MTALTVAKRQKGRSVRVRVGVAAAGLDRQGAPAGQAQAPDGRGDEGRQEGRHAHAHGETQSQGPQGPAPSTPAEALPVSVAVTGLGRARLDSHPQRHAAPLIRAQQHAPRPAVCHRRAGSAHARRLRPPPWRPPAPRRAARRPRSSALLEALDGDRPARAARGRRRAARGPPRARRMEVAEPILRRARRAARRAARGDPRARQPRRRAPCARGCARTARRCRRPEIPLDAHARCLPALRHGWARAASASATPASGSASVCGRRTATTWTATCSRRPPSASPAGLLGRLPRDGATPADYERRRPVGHAPGGAADALLAPPAREARRGPGRARCAPRRCRASARASSPPRVRDADRRDCLARRCAGRASRRSRGSSTASGSRPTASSLATSTAVGHSPPTIPATGAVPMGDRGLSTPARWTYEPLLVHHARAAAPVLARRCRSCSRRRRAAAGRATPPSRRLGAQPGERGHDQARLVRGDHRLGPVAQAELGQHPADVGLDRLLADDEPGGDLRVGQALGDQPQHLGLARGQRGRASAGRRPAARPQPGELGDQPPGDAGASSASPAATTRTASNSRSAVTSLSRKPLAPGAQRVVDVLVEVERGQDEHPRARLAGGRRAAGSPRCRP